MASEIELERLIVRLMGEGSSYQKMLAEATTVTDQLGQEMKRLGGTEAEFSAITARAAAVTETATQALGRHNWEQRRLQGLLDVGRISEESYERQVAKTGTVLQGATNALVRHSDAVARGLQITKSSETVMEAYKRQVAELDRLFARGAITQETYNRAGERLNSQLPRTIALEQQLATAMRQGEALTKQVMTAQDRYSAAVANANRLLSQNAITEQTRTRAIIAAQIALREATAVTSNFGKEVSRAGLSLRGFGTSWSIYVTAPLGAFLAASTMAGVKMDSLTRGLTAITHSAAKTKAQMVDMLEVAKLPGLGFKEAMEGNIRLQATGFSANLAKRSLLAFGNALATVGKGKADLDGIVLALTQISAKGKVMAQEINQLGERVPQIRKVMEQAFGTADTEKIQRMGLTSREFIEMVVTELEKLPKVTGGALNDLENFSDAAFIAFSKIGESVLTILRPAILSATEWVTYLGESFKNLSSPTQVAIIGLAGIAVAIGPITILAGQATIAIGGLITAMSYLTSTVGSFLLVVGVLNAALVALVLAGVVYATYELTGMGSAMQELNLQISESDRLSQDLATSMQRVAFEALAVADALEGVAKTNFLADKLTEANRNLTTYSDRLDVAKNRLLQLQANQEALDKFGGGQGIINYLMNIGKSAEAADAVQQLTKQFEAQEKVVEEAEKRLAAAKAGKSLLEQAKSQTLLTRETDTYIKSLERKIETLARGEAAAKLADLADRHAALGMKFNAEQIQKLIEKEAELKEVKAAKTEATKLQKDVDTLTAKLKAQVEAFGGVKYATDLQALADRNASKEALAAADGYSKKLDALKKAADLAEDVDKLNAKLRAEVAELKSGTESSEIFALSHRGAKDAVLETARALEIEKKALKETADLKKDIGSFVAKLESEVATFGMLSEEAELAAFAKRGAAGATFEYAKSLAAQKKALEDNKKLLEEAKKVNEKFQPKIKFINEYAELDKMFKAGAISAETLQLATKDLQADLLKAHDKADVRVRFTVEGNDAVRAGSAEFIKMISDVERRSKDVAILSGLSGAMSEIGTAGAILNDPALAAPGGGGFFSVAPEDVSSTPVATTISETESDVTLNGDKTLALLGRIADGIDDIADNPGVVLNGMGTF